MNNDDSSFTEKIIKHTILFYVMMVFLSFFQIYTYHHYFDIEINSYYSLYEYLICFIPSFIIPTIRVLITPWFVWFSLLVILVLYEFDLLFFNRKLGKFAMRLWNEPQAFFTTGRLKISTIGYKYMRIIYYIFSTFYITFILSLVLSLLSILLLREKFEGFWFILARDFIDPEGVNKDWFRVLFFLWSILTYVNLLRCVRKLDNHHRLRFSFNLTLIIFILFTFSTVKTSKMVAMKYNRIDKEKIEFYYKGNKIYTNYDKVLIGGTKDYIFLRDFTINVTEIYNLNDVTFLKYGK